MTRRLSILAVVAVIMIAFAGCKAISGLANFAKCNFDYNSVSDVTLCNIAVGNKTSLKDFSLQDALKIGNAFATKSFPLALNVNVDVHNPNTSVARLDGFEYILWIDDMKMTAGSMTKKILLNANEKTVMPLTFAIDLYEIFSQKGKEKLVTTACGLAGNDKAKSRVKLSLKPYLSVGNSVLRYPGYITIGGNRLMPSGN